MTHRHRPVIRLLATGLGLDVGFAVLVPGGLDVTPFAAAFHQNMALPDMLAAAASDEMGASVSLP